MSQSRKSFPELPGPPTNKHVTRIAKTVFGFKPVFPAGLSPTVSAFYKANKPLLQQPAGLFNSWQLGMQESHYVQQHGNPAHPGDHSAMQVAPRLRAAAASFTGSVLVTTHRALLEAHPDNDPTSAGGS